MHLVVRDVDRLKPPATGDGTPLGGLGASLLESPDFSRGECQGGTSLMDRPLITPEDNIVVWWGNSPKYRNEVTMANDTDSIYNFLVQELGKELADEIFGRA